ncbi:MAG: hypothetical protein AAFV45_04800 [Pseudomonadota bacterium]
MTTASHFARNLTLATVASVAVSGFTQTPAIAACDVGDLACQSQVSKSRIDRDMSAKPATQVRQWRLEPGQAPAPNPVEIEANGSTARVTTSLQNIHTYLSEKDNEKRSDVSALLPDDVELPTVERALPPRLDIWTATDIANVPEADHNQAIASQVGVDYRIKSNTLVGARIKTESIDDGVFGAPETGVLAGPYVATQVAPGLMLEAEGAWGRARSELDGAGEILANREQFRAGLSGDWTISGLTLAPSAHITNLKESFDPDSAAGTDRQVLTINPTLRRTFETDDGTRITPFLDYATTLDLETVTAPGADEGSEETVRNLGAGLAISKTGAYDINASTNLEHTDDTETPNIRSKLQLDVPLN